MRDNEFQPRKERCMSMSIGRNTIDGKKLLGYIERIERRKKDKKIADDDIRVIKAEAAKEGFSPKGIEFSVKVRAQKPSEFRENEDLRDLYLHAIGLAGTPPLFKQLESMAGDKLGKTEIIERFKELVPEGASITVEMEGPAIRITRDKEGKAKAEEVKPPKPTVTRRGAEAEADEPAVEVPDVDAAGAETLGSEAARDNKPIIENPFPFGDKRRARWDEGWRKQTGSDGMGPDEDRG